MKMKTLLFRVVLGLFAVVHSTPMNTVTQILAEAEGDALREAMTDGFLVNDLFLPSLTTEPPKMNTTVQASLQPFTENKEGDIDMFESSAAGETSDTYPAFFQDKSEYYATTYPSSTSTVFPRDADGSSTDSSTSPSFQSDFTSSSKPNVDDSFLSTLSLESEDGETLGQNPAISSTTTSSSHTETGLASLFAENEDSGSGMSEFTVTSIASSTNTEMSTESSTFQATSSSSSSKESGSDINARSARPVALVDDQATAHPKGHGTSDWIIIVGFVVGIAALVLLIAAIATKDKWRGPNRLESKTKSSHQQRGVEMETFLHKDIPRENGKAAEYTVIPLDELPDKHSY